MYRFTESTGQTAKYSARFGGLTAYGISFNIVVRSAPGGDRQLLGTWGADAASSQWRVLIGSDLKIKVSHSDGATVTTAAPNNTALVVNQLARFSISWNGAEVTYIRNGVADGVQALTRAVQNNNVLLTIGTFVGGSDAAPVDISQIIIGTLTIGATSAATRSWGFPLGLNPNLAAGNFDFWDTGGNPAHDRVTSERPSITAEAPSTVREPFAGKPYLSNLHPQHVSPPSPLKIINETVEVSEGKVVILPPLVQVVSESLSVQDGDNNDVFDPAGAKQEITGDGTTWTKVWPPFIHRTKWTSLG